MIGSHYRRRRKLSVPYIQTMAQAVYPEGGYDQLGSGTLMNTK